MTKHKSEQTWYVCIWDGKYATATKLLSLVVPGTVVLTAPGTVSNIYRFVDTDYLAQISHFWKTVYMNSPNAFRRSGSSIVRRHCNVLLDSISQMFSYLVDILENILLRSSPYILQMSKNDVHLQRRYRIDIVVLLGVFYGVVYLPRFISNTWVLARSELAYYDSTFGLLNLVQVRFNLMSLFKKSICS